MLSSDNTVISSNKGGEFTLTSYKEGESHCHQATAPLSPATRKENSTVTRQHPPMSPATRKENSTLNNVTGHVHSPADVLFSRQARPPFSREQFSPQRNVGLQSAHATKERRRRQLDHHRRLILPAISTRKLPGLRVRGSKNVGIEGREQRGPSQPALLTSLFTAKTCSRHGTGQVVYTGLPPPGEWQEQAMLTTSTPPDTTTAVWGWGWGGRGGGVNELR